MTDTLKHYIRVIQITEGSDTDKVRAVLTAYSNPVGKWNPASCFYQRARTFSSNIRDLLARTSRQQPELFIIELNAIFKTPEQKKRIKKTGDFNSLLRAISSAIEGSFVNSNGGLDLISLRGMTPSPSPVTFSLMPHEFRVEHLSLTQRHLFLSLKERLFNILNRPIIDLKEVDEIMASCSKSEEFKSTDLINFHDSHTGETALHACIQPCSGDEYVSAQNAIDYLISNGANVNAQNMSGETALFKASLLKATKIATNLRYNHHADNLLSSNDAPGLCLPTDYLRFSVEEAKLHEMTTFPPEDPRKRRPSDLDSTASSYTALSSLLRADRTISSTSAGCHTPV